MKKFKELIKLMYIFSILGFQMFGNLVTMIPIFEKELVEKRNLISKEDTLDSITIGRCGPGAAIINTVAFLGNKISGLLGSIFATIGFIFFPFLIIILIASSIDAFITNKYIQSFFVGMSTCMSILIINSVIDFGKSTLTNKFNILLFAITLILSICTDIPNLVFIVLSGILGYIFY